MTTPDTTTDTAPENGAAPAATTVARPNRATLTPEMQAAVEERRLRGALLQQIRGATWSKDITPDAVRAIANWAFENEVDPATELDVLGGNLYLKGRYYERKLGELIGAGVIAWARGEWINNDPRLTQLMQAGDEWAKAEHTRRLRLRIEYNVDELSDAAMVYRIRHALMNEPVEGVKFHVPGRKKTIKPRNGGQPFQVDADPVGDQSPTETIETRALRRAMLKLKAARPELRLAVANDDGAADVNDAIVQGKEATRALRASLQPRQLGVGAFAGYDLPAREEVPVEPLTVVPRGIEPSEPSAPAAQAETVVPRAVAAWPNIPTTPLGTDPLGEDDDEEDRGADGDLFDGLEGDD